MAELDGIVGVLESNSLELEDSLRSYERGVALLAALQGRLAEDVYKRQTEHASSPSCMNERTKSYTAPSPKPEERLLMTSSFTGSLSDRLL